MQHETKVLTKLIKEPVSPPGCHQVAAGGCPLGSLSPCHQLMVLLKRRTACQLHKGNAIL